MKLRLPLFILMSFVVLTTTAQTQIAVCPQNATFSSMTRGYYFTAPCNFTICGLYVPTDASAGNQSVAIVRFTAGPPPTFGGTTNSFVSLFYQPNYAINAMISCNVQVNTGDIIGIYGSRGAAVNSYGLANCPTTILGNPVTLYRSGMQYDLAVTPMQEIWYEDYNIGRVFMYIDCCPTANFTVTTPICLGETATATYTGSGTPPSASFSWTFTGGVPATANTIGPHNITYATPGNKTVSLEVSQAGCTTVTSTQTIVVDPNPVVTINPSSASVCTGQSVTITANGANSYNWSGGLGTNATQNVSPATTTTYTVTGTTGGCTGTASVTVTVNPNLTVSLTPSAPQICQGQSVSITASGGTTYNWSGGLGTGATQNVSPATTTTYTVTGTDAFGCSGTASVTVTVNPNPTVTINPAAPAICNGQSVTILAGGADTYNWSGGLGTNAAQNVSPAATTTYTVTGTSTAGCTGTASATVTVNPDPTITASANPSGVCLGNSTTLSAAGGNTYLWDSGNTNASWDVTPTVTTTYFVTGTDANGCTGTAQVQVDVFDNLTVTITPANPEICEGDNINLTASSNGNNPTYSWSGGQNTATINVSPASTTTYTVTATDITGCSGTASVSVIVNPLPYVHFEALPLSGCVPITVNFQNLSDAGSYVWNFGDGSTSNNTNPVHQYANSGNYTVTLTVTSNGCTSSLSMTNYINVYPMPLAGFMPSANVVEQGQATVLFTDLSFGASLWLWDFGTGIYSTNQNPEYTYSNEGEYIVWQYVENQWGCRDSTYKTITVKPSVTFYIPNAFSPNGDGINDFFHPYGNNIGTDNYQMIIYDRWGKQIFRTDNINTPWDGTSPDSGGKIVPTGVYIYKIKVTLDGLEKVFEGIVTLIF